MKSLTRSCNSSLGASAGFFMEIPLLPSSFLRRFWPSCCDAGCCVAGGCEADEDAVLEEDEDEESAGLGFSGALEACVSGAT